MRYLVVAAPLVLAAIASAANVTATWNGGAAGNWNLNTNWSRIGVPNNGANLYFVIIDGNGGTSSAVSLTNLSPTISTLTIGGNDSLTIANGLAFFLIGGALTNDGQLLVNSSGSTTDFRLDANAAFSGAGVFRGSNTQSNRLYGINSTVRLTNNAGHTIAGSAQIGVNQTRLTNDGQIETDLSAGMAIDLVDGAGINFNPGTLRASNGAKLSLNSWTVENAGGLIEAAAGSFVDLSAMIVNGGTIRDTDGAGPGVVRNVNSLTLKDVTLDGPFLCPNGTATRLQGAMQLLDTTSVSSSGGTTDVLIETSPFTLAGGGELFFSNTLANRIYGITGAVVLTVPSDFTLHGSCSLGVNQLRLVNQSIIDADSSASMAIDLVDGAGINFNTGTLRASNGAKLSLNSWTVENAGGLIEAAAGSFVDLSAMIVNGGTIRDTDGAGPGVVRNVNSLTLKDVTLDGPFLCPNGTATRLQGAMQLLDTTSVSSSGGTTDVLIETSPFTLAGGGELLFSNTLANRIYGITGAVVLTVPSDFTLHGSCSLGVNQLRLVNQSIIDADSSASMAIDLVDGAGINFNTGTLRASNGAKLSLNSWTVENAGGLIEAAAGSFVDLSAMIVNGGTIRDTDGAGPGVVRNVNSLTLKDVTLDGPFLCPNGTATRLQGAMQLLDTTSVSSSGGTTDVLIETSPFTLAGGGELLFSNTLANRIYGVTGAVRLINGAGNSIRGACQLGINQVGFTNDGAVVADASAGMTIDVTDTQDFTNNGSLWSKTGNITINNGPFTTSGTVLVDAGRTLTRAGNFTQTSGVTTVNGTLTLNSSGQFQLQGGQLAGGGIVGGGLVSNTGGIAAPGNSSGILTCGLGYTQTAGGTLSVQIGGLTPGTQHDQLAVTGNAVLAGTLNVTRINGFIPSVGNEFTILTTTGTRTGTFATVESCDAVSVIYGANFVKVTYTGMFGSIGDLDNDGFVNGADLASLLGAWGPCGGECCNADLDGDGEVNGADLATLLGNWS